MKCQFCSAELADDAFSCPQCRARKMLRRSRAGVITGWIAIVLAFHMCLVWIPLPIMMFAGFNIGSIPWQLDVSVVLLTIVMAALFWYSNSTRHLEWVSGNE